MALAVIVVAVRQSLAHRSSWPIACVAGLSLASFYEPIGDLLGHVRYHEASFRLIRSFGADIPLWVLPTYVALFAGPSLVLQKFAAARRPLSHWLMIAAGAGAGSFALEATLVQLGMIVYYGAQPFTLLHYPLWMAAANGAVVLVVSGWLAVISELPIARRWPSCAVILSPMLFAGSHCLISLPTGLALNSTADQVSLNVASLVSVAIAVMLVVATQAALTNRLPEDLGK